MRVDVVSFPGSNCDDDCVRVVREVLGGHARKVWHTETALDAPDLVIVPGGFSFGDYLRCGAIARFSPVLEAVRAFAHAGGPVLGICNGFQILTEAGLLPGALRRNVGLSFVCQDVHLRVDGREDPVQVDLVRVLDPSAKADALDGGPSGLLGILLELSVSS